MQNKSSIKFTPIPAFTSNYIWAICNEHTREAYIVDPGTAEPVLTFLDTHNWALKGVLITHSHDDHIGGIPDILSNRPAPVIGPKCEAITRISVDVREGSSYTLWDGCSAVIYHIPGHLPEHIAFYLTGSLLKEPAVMCGDTLFSSGCGRMFSGPAQTYKHSIERIAAFPDDTLLYCAHEYTLDNIHFARTVEPSNQALQDKLDYVQQKIAETGCSLPTNVGIEKQTNPFLRCNQLEIKKNIGKLMSKTPIDDVETFALLRKLKDTY